MSKPIPLYKHHAKKMTNDVWLDHVADMYDDFYNGKSVYVRYSNPSDVRRTGSIARIQTMGYDADYLINGGSWYQPKATRKPYSKATLRNSYNFINMGYSTYMLTWDGRYNQVTAYGNEIEWLKDHTGGTEWVWQKPEVPKVIAYDSLNREIKVGDFVVYVLHNASGDKGASAHFGNITKVEENGQVWAKNVKIHDKEEVAEKRIKHNSNVTILTKDLMQQLMLAKLRTI